MVNLKFATLFFVVNLTYVQSAIIGIDGVNILDPNSFSEEGDKELVDDARNAAQCEWIQDDTIPQMGNIVTAQTNSCKEYTDSLLAEDIPETCTFYLDWDDELDESDRQTLPKTERRAYCVKGFVNEFACEIEAESESLTCDGTITSTLEDQINEAQANSTCGGFVDTWLNATMDSCHARYGWEDVPTSCATYFDYGTGRWTASCVTGEICEYTCESIWNNSTELYEARCQGSKCETGTAEAKIDELETLYSAWMTAQDDEERARNVTKHAEYEFIAALQDAKADFQAFYFGDFLDRNRPAIISLSSINSKDNSSASRSWPSRTFLVLITVLAICVYLNNRTQTEK